MLIASNDKAADVLGWRPTRDLDRMVSDAWDFYQQQFPQLTDPTGGGDV